MNNVVKYKSENFIIVKLFFFFHQILEKSLKILFKSYDVQRVKNYVQTQFSKLLSGRASIIDCIFAKEYRGISGYRPGACVPALEIAK